MKWRKKNDPFYFSPLEEKKSEEFSPSIGIAPKRKPILRMFYVWNYMSLIFMEKNNICIFKLIHK